MSKEADRNEEHNGLCFDCGAPAVFLIYVAGEDERPREEYACEVHARGHWRSAILEPATSRRPIVVDAW
jgi:hypothetical protein